MAKPILDDALWALIEPLLPEPEPRRRRGGRLMPGRPPVTTSRMTFGPMRVVMPTSDLTLTPLPSSVGMWHDWHRST